jgi:hypothetical protein
VDAKYAAVELRTVSFLLPLVLLDLSSYLIRCLEMTEPIQTHVKRKGRKPR